MGWFVTIFVLALAQCCALTWCALRMGRRFRILDFPDKQRKFHAHATPRTGGLAVCGALALGVGECVAVNFAQWGGAAQAGRFTGFLLLSAALLCALGLWDDKYGMRARTKFLWQAAFVLPFVCWGRSTTTANLFGWQLDFAWLAVPVILFWLVSCTNFVNLVDGLDGLAGSVGLIVALTVATLAWWHQLDEVCLVAMILSGALMGFLAFNWPPARIFLGDSGSLPLGFLVGALSLEASAKKATGLTLAVPVVLLSIPIFDTSMAILRRKLNGRKIGQGDRAHIHHCLRDRGLSPTQTLLWIGAMCAGTATAAVLATVFNNDLIAIALSLVLLAALIAGRVFGFDETMLLVRHVQAVGRFMKLVPRALRVKFVVVRLEKTVAAGQPDLWHKIVKRAKRLDGLAIEFVCEDVSGGRELVALNWTSDRGRVEGRTPVWELSYAAPREGGVQMRFRASGQTPGSAGVSGMAELSELLVALCDNWPVPATAALLADDAQTPLRTRDEPQILTAPWGVLARVKELQETPRRAVESDAA